MRNSGYDPGRPRRSPWGICCGGCFGVFAVLVVVLMLFYAGTGHYRPNIPPPSPLPNPNGLDDYIAAGGLLKAAGGTGAMYNGPNGATTLAGEQAVVAKNQAALVRMRQAFGKECRIPRVRTFLDIFPYLANVRDLARLTAAEADVKAARGDHAGAFDAGLDIVQMGEDIDRGGPLIHGLVAIALQAIANRPLVDNIEKLSAQECDRMAKRLQSLLRSRVSAEMVLQQEKIGTLTSLMNMDPRDIVSIIPMPYNGDPENPQTPPSPAQQAAGGLAWHFLRDRTLVDIERYLSGVVREVAKPAASRRPVPEPTSPIAAMLAPVSTQVAAKFDETDAHNRLILIALKIRAFRLTHGSLPGSLSALGIDPALLTDPYSGKTLVYRLRGGDYLLYSVGPDLKDDGGVPVDEGSSVASSTGDIGVRRFTTATSSGGKPGRDYRRVPYMKPPALPPGARPLPE